MADEKLNLPLENEAETAPVEEPKKAKVKEAPKKDGFFKRFGKGLKKFWSDTVNEMKKVHWTPKNELKKSTVIVVVAVLITAVMLGLIDTAFSSLINWIAGLIG